MTTYYSVLYCLFSLSTLLKADNMTNKESNVDLLLFKSGAGYLTSIPDECSTILNEFAEYASNFTKCSIINARPIRICERCIEQYMSFYKKYQELLTTVVNGTSCKSEYISHDRLDAVLEYYNNIISIWNKGHCNACYNWTNEGPKLSNETIHFNERYNETRDCIKKYTDHTTNDNQACDNCMQSYIQLDNYYKTLSEDAIGVDSICMDIVDMMNATRYTWSKTLNCCKIRRTPEIIFLCCSGIISALPLFYYLVLRFCSPMRDLPNVLKQSRFKQSILRSLGRANGGSL